ncbi:MAG: glycosyltransferase family 2 protein, partial [Gammaproteobacteria bacterium]|nr:glycosyltransferase family 2 protein [Gammaproteobacteria bacterium]
HHAMIDYELHLRYYIAGQRLAGFPYAFHTVGSALACSSAVYVAQGGMNLRQGGEDFYFAQKLIAVGGYRALNDTTVYPGVRLSTRVPFGTGPALSRALQAGTGAELETYAPQIFRDLATFCATLAQATPANMSTFMAGLPAVLRQFLVSQGFSDRLDEIGANVASDPSFRQRVSRWFNAFRFLKFAQYASRSAYPRVPVSVAARELADQDLSRDTAELLRWYRCLDRDS